jgi:predicted nucleic acid-binding Zn ribbon protein
MPDPRRQAPRTGPAPAAAPLGELLSQVKRQIGLEARRPLHPTFAAWEQVVDQAFAGHTAPVRFRGGELLVEVTSATHHHELVAFHGERLRTAINRELGQELVERLLFKHCEGPRTAPPRRGAAGNPPS